MPPTETNENGAGPVIATIIIMAVIILGGLYFWGERSNSMNDINEETASDSTAAITSQSSSDETNSIEADLSDTDVDSLGNDLDNL